MEKLHWLKIKNYRGIKEAHLEDFGDINIIVGKNNTGKSTILEAIYLNVARQTPDLLGNHPLILIFSRRGASRFPLGGIRDFEDISPYFSYIFYNGDIEREAKFKSNIGEYWLSVITGDKIDKKMFDLIARYYPGMTARAYEKSEIVIKPSFVIVDSTKNPIITILEKVEETTGLPVFRIVYMPRGLKPKATVKKIIIVDDYMLFGREIPDRSKINIFLSRFEKIVQIDKEELVKFLSKQLDVDIKTVQLGIFDIYIITRDDVSIPFSLLGDGTKMSLVYFYTLSLRNSYILFEEPENHLHPKLMDHCTDLMIKSSDRNQIFITTHNIEFIKIMLEKAKNSNKNLKVFSIANLKDGILEYDVYDLEEAHSAMNKIGVDLR